MSITTRHTRSRQLLWTVIIATTLMGLLALATLGAPQRAAAIIPAPTAPVATATPLPAPAVNLKIDFQPAGAPTYPGYLADTGLAYGDRGNGYSYGWDRNPGVAAFDRDVLNAPDQRYDTGAFINDDPNATVGYAARWEVALPNGWYEVNIYAGDPATYDGHVYAVEAENVLVTFGVADANVRWFHGGGNIRVTDGRLTVRSSAGAKHNVLLFMTIVQRQAPLKYPIAYPVRINFQPAGAVAFPGYMVDSGALYGDRGSGWSYGWQSNNTAAVLDRNASNAPDQRYDTFAYLKKDGVSRTWEILLPPGWYRVTVVGGDPSAYLNTGIIIKAEGRPIVSQVPTADLRWIEGHGYVYVADGKLTLTSGASQSMNAINFVEIAQAWQESQINVAMGKEATQSTYSAAAYHPGLAADGNADGTLANGSVAMTDSTSGAYWQVDLGAEYDLALIRVFGRTDCCASRLTNFYIFTSKTGFSSTSWSTTLNQPGVTSQYVQGPLSGPYILGFAGTARYIRVQLTGTNYLALAEVEVVAKFPDPRWAASATDTPDQYAAANALDSSPQTRWRSVNNQGSVPQSFTVDLRSQQTFSRLILDAGTSTGEYPRAYAVDVSNDASNWITVSTGTGTQQLITISFPNVTRRYVRIRQTGSAAYPWSIHQLGFDQVPVSEEPPAPLKVLYWAAEPAPTAPYVRPHIMIINSEPAQVPLSELKLRYYYTPEGTSPETFYCIYTSFGCAIVTGSFKPGYLEVGFTAGAGSIPPGGLREVHMGFAKSDGSIYNQANDFSFDPSKLTYGDGPRVPLYRNGTRVWGVEP